MKKVLISFCVIFCVWSCKQDNKTEEIVNKKTTTEQEEKKSSEKEEGHIVYQSKKDSIMDYSTTTSHVHAAKTQYYRWYQVYERDFLPSRIKNQMDILSDDVEITTAAGTLKGKATYPDRLKAYEGWKNAHHVQFANVQSYPDGTLRINAEIIFQNIKPEGEKSQVKIAYDVYTSPLTSSELPTLNAVNIKPVEVLEVTDFKDAYPTNRVLSLMHYWLFNVEKRDGNSEPFKALLTEEFELNFSQNRKIKNLEEFDAWLKGASSQVTETNHFPENIVITQLSENRYKLEVDFIWRGKTIKGVSMKAHTQHTWLIEDNIEEPFARIKQMNVKYKEPFTAIEE